MVVKLNYSLYTSRSALLLSRYKVDIWCVHHFPLLTSYCYSLSSLSAQSNPESKLHVFNHISTEDIPTPVLILPPTAVSIPLSVVRCVAVVPRSSLAEPGRAPPSTSGQDLSYEVAPTDCRSWPTES